MADYIKIKDIDRAKLTNESSSLSMQLSSGKLDPRVAIREINSLSSNSELTDGQKEYLSQIKRQLVFREFANSALKQQTYRQPPGAVDKLSKEFKDFSEGNTGIPLIDASVNKLVDSGFAHNRSRLAMARHAIRTLNIEPEVVSDWFKEHLKDYDPTLNTFNIVQASSGSNFSEPYFRASNAATASKKLDPENEFIKEWLPEYGPTSQQTLDSIKSGNKKWRDRWESVDIKELPKRKLYPTKDASKSIFFIEGKLPAKGSFAPYYKKYLENEKDLLG